jgi:hypothetical protein
MRTRREIELGAIAGAVGALLLLVSLFFDWFGGLTAFTAYEVLDLALAALALAALASSATRLGAPLPHGLAGAGAPVAALALVVVVSQLLNHPPIAIDLAPSGGLWLGLAGSALMVAGAALAAAGISLAVDLDRRSAPGREAPAAEQREPPA